MNEYFMISVEMWRLKKKSYMCVLSGLMLYVLFILDYDFQLVDVNEAEGEVRM